jgi:flagellar biosynthesis protein FlhF
MDLETFRGPDMGTALALVRATLGEDAMIIHTARSGADGVEVVAAPATQVEPLHAALDPDDAIRITADGPVGRPRVVALVGPTGAGKTTTAAKLALHADAFGGKRVGFLGLDTYRVAALEQLQTYADIMGAPFEVAYHAGDVEPAMSALAECDVVIVDAPGRSPAHSSFTQWRVALGRTRPDEVHLVLPATIQPRVGRAHRDGYGDCHLTHLLVTKLDEMPDAAGAVELAETLRLPVRWTTDGQDVPGDLRRGGSGLLTTAVRAAERARVRLAG